MRLQLILACLVSTCLAGCSSRANEGTIAVAIIGQEDAPFETGNRLSFAGQLVREATTEGLVAIDAQGQVVPAIAERWIVTDDGLSYFFRIRGSDWPSGDALNAASVRAALDRAITALDGTALGLDLDMIDEIRIMADRVIEVRLKGPMPEFLQLLAQPELGLRSNGAGTGPMVRTGKDGILLLQAIPPERRGMPEQRDWEDEVLDVTVRGLPADRAVEAFRNGELELLLNGRLSTLPLADVGPLSSGTMRFDAAVGLFGLSFRNTSGVLASAARREAMSMAIDRETLLQPFNVAGWQPTTRIVGAGIFPEGSGPGQRWAGLSLEQRRREASGRIAAWERAEGEPAIVSVALPAGPGSELLYDRLAGDLATIGVQLERAKPGAAADLTLVDRLARYSSPRWFLNQFNCDIAKPVCSPDADVLVDQALYVTSLEETLVLLAQAERSLIEREAFIPLGSPLRWSLVRGTVDGFADNIWGRHPLFPLATAPTS